VLFEAAVSADNVGTSAELVAHTLDMQALLIDRFMPAAPAQFPDLPAYPTGLLCARPRVISAAAPRAAAASVRS
jgi:hypothetical protein